MAGEIDPLEHDGVVANEPTLPKEGSVIERQNKDGTMSYFIIFNGLEDLLEEGISFPDINILGEDGNPEYFIISNGEKVSIDTLPEDEY